MSCRSRGRGCTFPEVRRWAVGNVRNGRSLVIRASAVSQSREIECLHAGPSPVPSSSSSVSTPFELAVSCPDARWRAFLSPPGPSADASATNDRALWDAGTLLGQLTRSTGNTRVGGWRNCSRDRGKCVQMSVIVG